MTARRRRSQRRHDGFTLVEVMVALTLLSLVMLVLGSAIRSMGASAQRIDARSASMDEMRVATTFLREVAGRPSAQRAEAPATGLLFSGASHGMSWIGVMPARFGAAGRHFFRLDVGPLGDGTEGLVLRFVPWTPEQKVLPDWSKADSRVLVRHVDAATFAYEGDGMSQGWRAAWPQDEKRLPPRVRLLLTVAGTPWPPVVLALHALPASGPGAGGGFVRGAE
ncbi:MAG: type II secretion system protein J [Ramlibacter sp.]